MRRFGRCFGTLSSTLEGEMVRAMKAKDKIRLGVVRNVRSKIVYKQKANKNEELDDAQILDVIQAMIVETDKTLAEMGKLSGERAEELVNVAQAEKTILLEFLPQQLSEAEVMTQVDEVIARQGAKSVKEMRGVMEELTPRLSGRFDKKALGKLVRDKLAASKD